MEKGDRVSLPHEGEGSRSSVKLSDKSQFIALFKKEPRLGKVKIACNFRFASGIGKNASELSNRMQSGISFRFAR